MATGTGHGSPLSYTSEEVFDSECFNCSQDGKHVEAEVFCVECGDNFCRSCLHDHNKIARLRAHHIQDKSAVKPGTTQGAPHPPSEKCFQHHGRLIDTFCVGHNAVCCPVCVSVDHKSCPDMRYIPAVASGISTSKELQDTRTATGMVKSQLEATKATRLGNLAYVRQQRNEALEKATELKEKLKEYIEEIGQKTAAEIMQKYQDLEEAINSNLDQLTKVIAALEDAQIQLQQSQNNETKLFVHLKRTSQTVTTGKQLIEAGSPDVGQESCAFEMDSSIEKCLESFKRLGAFQNGAEFTAVPISDVNVKSVNDKSGCRITGFCRVEDGGLVIADYSNNCLKKLDKSFEIESRCDLFSAPWGVCRTHSGELAVTMYNDWKIQFVSEGRAMSLTRSFNTSGNGECRGIAYRDEKLYVCRGSVSVQVYAMNGTLLQITDRNEQGAPVFGTALNITINPNTMCIYIADFNNGLTILDKSGQLVTTINDPELRETYGICELPGNHLLVCGCSSNNVIQFDCNGHNVRTLLSAQDGLKSPEALHFDPVTFTLTIGMYRCDKIKVFRVMNAEGSY